MQIQGRTLTDAVTALPGDRVRVSFKAAPKIRLTARG